MKVWTCTDHDGHYPVGVASVIVADSESQARLCLETALIMAGLDPLSRPFTLQPLDTETQGVRILCDGNY